MKLPTIITDQQKLITKCAPTTLKEGERIGEVLKKVLKENKSGVGLAANQIGINKRVCLIKVDRTIVLVNPTIVQKFGRIIFEEGCLSFPGDYISTMRYNSIAVKADNHKSLLFFHGDGYAKTLECVCVQHEIDHLNGITMYERQAIRGEKDG